MSPKPNTQNFIGLDIGSSKVACVIGQLDPSGEAVTVIGLGSAETTSVRKGVVTDIEETVSSISAALDEAERVAGVRVQHASIGVNGAHVKTLGSHGVVAISSGKEITLEDVARAEEAASIVQLPPNRQLLDIFTRSFSIDGQEQIKEPIGMTGVRLEVDTRLITVSTPPIKNIERVCEQAGVAIDARLLNPVAASMAVLDKRARDVGTVVVDIGADTVGVAVYEEGELLHAAVIPIGAGHITNDLAIGLRTDIDVAEKIKREHVKLSEKPGKKQLSLKNSENETLQFSAKETHDIVQARLEEIFDHVDADLKSIHRSAGLPGGALITGGGAKLHGMRDFAKDALRLPVHVVGAKEVTGIIDDIQDPSYATAVGLMMDNYLHGSHANSSRSGMSGFGDTARGVTDFFKGLIGRHD